MQELLLKVIIGITLPVNSLEARIESLFSLRGRYPTNSSLFLHKKMNTLSGTVIELVISAPSAFGKFWNAVVRADRTGILPKSILRTWIVNFKIN